jgi:hypothetical protein
MTMTKNPIDEARRAQQFLAEHPEAVAAARAEDDHKADEAAKQAKKIAAAEAIVERELADLTDALEADYFECERRAVREEAATLARQILEHRHVLPIRYATKPQVLAAQQPPHRLSVSRVQAAMNRLRESPTLQTKPGER